MSLFPVSKRIFAKTISKDLVPVSPFNSSISKNDIRNERLNIIDNNTLEYDVILKINLDVLKKYKLTEHRLYCPFGKEEEYFMKYINPKFHRLKEYSEKDLKDIKSYDLPLGKLMYLDYEYK